VVEIDSLAGGLSTCAVAELASKARSALS